MSTKSNKSASSDVSEVTETSLPTTSDYLSADRSEKAKMRAMVEKAMKSAIDAFDLDAAKAAKDLLDTFVTVRAEKVEKDYNGMVSAYVTALRVMAEKVESGEVSVPGVPDGFVYVAPESAPSESEVANMVSILSGVKPFRNANRNDIHGAIEQAFEDVEVSGFMTFGAIARKMGLPSSGAVAAAAARGDFPDNLDITPKSGSTGAGFTKTA